MEITFFSHLIHQNKIKKGDKYMYIFYYDVGCTKSLCGEPSAI